MVRAPTPEKWHLKNGAQCISSLIPDAPLTCIDLWCRAGSYYEKEAEEGIAHFLEHMVFKGSSKLKEGEFDEIVESLGGSSNAATGFDDVHFYILLPPKDLNKGINLLTNLVLTPRLNKDAYFAERKVVLEEISQHQDIPEERIFQKLLTDCWKSQAYGRSILGHKDSLNKSSPETMRSFHERMYIPDNLVLSVAGDLPKNILYEIENSIFNEIEGSNKIDITANKPRLHEFNKGYIEIEEKRLESSRIYIAWPLPPAHEQMNIMGADIATSLLSEGRLSRLVLHLREKLQIVDSIEMDITSLEKGGLIILEASCEEENIQLVQKEIWKVIKRTYEDEISIKEFSRAKKLISNSICFNLETTSQIAGISGYQALWNRHQELLKPLDLINRWTIHNLQDEILRKLNPNNSYTLIAKPKKL